MGDPDLSRASQSSGAAVCARTKKLSHAHAPTLHLSTGLPDQARRPADSSHRLTTLISPWYCEPPGVTHSHTLQQQASAGPITPRLRAPHSCYLVAV